MNLLREYEEAESAIDIFALLLDDLATLADVARIAHWNVTGPMFGSLHAIYGDLYDFANEQMDVIAERLRYYDVLLGVERDVEDLEAKDGDQISMVIQRLNEVINNVAASYDLMSEVEKDFLVVIEKALSKFVFLISSHK